MLEFLRIIIRDIIYELIFSIQKIVFLKSSMQRQVPLIEGLWFLPTTELRSIRNRFQSEVLRHQILFFEVSSFTRGE